MKRFGKKSADFNLNRVMELKRKLFGTTADKITEGHPKSREAGRIIGATGIGVAGGLGVKALAEKSPKAVDKIRTAILFKPGGKVGADGIKEAAASRWKEGSKQYEKVEKVHKIARKATDKVAKFAKTKGGKATLIGVPTALIAGGVYKYTKNKDKK